MVPIVITTMGVIQWRKKEIQDLDIATRKHLTMKGSFHRARDVDRLYISRKQGGRGLRNIEDGFECRIIQLAEHLEANAGSHEYLELVRQHEETRIVRLGKEFRERCKEQTESSNVKERKRKEHKDRRTGKVTHGYLQKRIEADQNIDTEKTNQWLNLRFTSHIEGYVSAIQGQEIETKRREKNPEIKRNMNTKCRACNKFDESVFHLICSCPALAPTLYLNMRHNQVARILYQEIIHSENMIYKPPPVTKKNNLEIWSDNSITTVTRVEKKRPDIIIWDTTSKICKIVDVGVPLDTNLENVYQDRKSKYIPLIGQMQQIYMDYNLIAIAITVGCLNFSPKETPTGT